MPDIILLHPPTPYPPIGALYVADALEQARHAVHLWPSDISDTMFRAVVAGMHPLFVGFSAYTYPSLTDMMAKSKIVHDLGIPTVWGGQHPTGLPDETLAEEYISHVILGDGEEPIVTLTNDLLNNTTRHGFYGAYASPTFHLDNYRPAWHHIDLDQYIFPSSHSVRGGDITADRVFYYLSTSRGCPFRCRFCVNSREPKPPWRMHSVEWVKEQVAYLRRETSLDGIGFWDDFFFGNRHRAIEIVEFLREQGIKFLCECRATDLTPEFTHWLKDMGCLQIFVGAESGSDRVLAMIDKRITIDDIVSAVFNANDCHLPIRLSFIYGFPGETVAEMLQTRNLVHTLKAFPNVSISGPKLYTPYPGTSLYQDALSYGFDPPARTEDWAEINRESDLEHLPWVRKELEGAGMTLEDLGI